jgi:hypothetical protein
VVLSGTTVRPWSPTSAAGSPPRFGILDLYRLWEWTADPMPGRTNGRVCRGGRYRDTPAEPAAPIHRSFDDDGAADIGFRCVADDDNPSLMPLGATPTTPPPPAPRPRVFPFDDPVPE